MAPKNLSINIIFFIKLKDIRMSSTIYTFLMVTVFSYLTKIVIFWTKFVFCCLKTKYTDMKGMFIHYQQEYEHHKN